MQSKNDFTQGSIPQAVMRLALPMIGAQIINALYSVVDKMYIGRLPDIGADALAGVGITFPFIMIVSAFAMLAGMGGAPLCSIARGEGDIDGAEKIMGCSMAFLLALGVGVTVLSLAIKGPALYWFGATPEIYAYADQYISIYLLGSLFVMMTLGMNPFINSQGFSRTGMITVALGAVINIILDPVFMFALGMGVRGAALATILSQAASALWVVAFLRGKQCILRLRREYIRLDKAIIGRVAALGASTCTMNITESIVSIACNQTLSIFGGKTYLSVMTGCAIASASPRWSARCTPPASAWLPCCSPNSSSACSTPIRPWWRPACPPCGCTSVCSLCSPCKWRGSTPSWPWASPGRPPSSPCCARPSSWRPWPFCCPVSPPWG